jgi:leucyl/phenylalanyl-tRNA---protein transferase
MPPDAPESDNDDSSSLRLPVRRTEGLASLKSSVRPYLSAAVGSLSTLTAAVGTRVGAASSQPAPSEVLANYARGWVLFGIPDNRMASLEWRTFPRRAIITPETAKVPKRLRPIQRRSELEVRFDHDFETIVRHCQEGRDGWLTPETVDVYRRVHALGFISTVGTYRDGRLVGGLWGVVLGRTFGIMSMFHTEDHSGSLALAALIEEVRDGDRWSMADCGQLKENFVRYGAFEVPIEQFCEMVWTHSRGALRDDNHHPAGTTEDSEDGRDR